MSPDRLPVALWGIGRHATRRLLPAIEQSKSLALVGVCTRNRDLGSTTATKMQCRYYDTPEAMLADEHVKAVIVSTPTGLHHEHGVAVLNAGKHLLCEKPFAHSYQSTIDLFELAAKKEKRAVSGLMYKYHPQFQELKSIIQQGTLGELRALSIKFGMPTLNANTFRDDPTQGGGAALDITCYPLSLAYQLLPSPPKLSASSVMTRDNGNTDTDGWCVLELDGVIVDCQWGMGRAYQNIFEAWGSKGVLRCERVFTKDEDHESQLVLYDYRGNKEAEIDTGSANAYVLMFDTISANLNNASFFELERAETEWCAKITDQILRQC